MLIKTISDIEHHLIGVVNREFVGSVARRVEYRNVEGNLRKRRRSDGMSVRDKLRGVVGCPHV